MGLGCQGPQMAHYGWDSLWAPLHSWRDRTNDVWLGLGGEKNLEEVRFVFAELCAKVGAEMTFENSVSNYHSIISLITVLSGSHCLFLTEILGEE